MFFNKSVKKIVVVSKIYFDATPISCIIIDKMQGFDILLIVGKKSILSAVRNETA